MTKEQQEIIMAMEILGGDKHIFDGHDDWHPILMREVVSLYFKMVDYEPLIEFMESQKEEGKMLGEINPEDLRVISDALNLPKKNIDKLKSDDINFEYNGKKHSINSNTWDKEKEEKLFQETGLKSFREKTDAKNLVFYNPEYFIIVDGWLRYKNTIEKDIPQPINMSSSFLMFYNCTNLQSLDLSTWDVSNVTDMSCMFKNCKNLQSIDLSNWDVSNLTDMSCMFSNCTSLQSIDLSTWDVSNVMNMSSMFSNCTNLQSLDLSDWDVSNVTGMSYMFYNCENLHSKYNILDDRELLQKIILDELNYDISFEHSGKKYYINSHTWDNEKEEKLFRETGLKSFREVTGNKNLVFYNQEYFEVNRYSVTPSFLHYRGNMEKDIPQPINMSSGYHMFYDCEKLQSIDLSTWDVSNVTNMGSMFDRCINLQYVDLGNWDVGCLTNIRGMFSDCKKLQNLDLSNWNISKIENTYDAFLACENLYSKYNTLDDKELLQKIIEDSNTDSRPLEELTTF